MNLASSWDHFLLILGNPGRYQILIAFLLCFLQIPCTLVSSLWKFYSSSPPHRCFIPPALRSGGLSANEWIPQVTDPFGGTMYSSCEMYLDPYNTKKGTTQCLHGYEYKPFLGEQHNIIMEWNLVCSSKELPLLIYYSFNLATIAGAIGLSLIADKFGRRPILLLTFYLFVPIVFIIHFVQDFQLFTILFSLQAFFTSGVQICSYVLLIEMMPKMYQFKASLMTGVAIVTGYMILPMIVWGIESWRYVQLAVSVPGIVLIGSIWVLPESPLWTLTQGRSLEAESLFQQLGKRNGKPLPSNLRDYLEAAANYFINNNNHNNHVNSYSRNNIHKCNNINDTNDNNNGNGYGQSKGNNVSLTRKVTPITDEHKPETLDFQVKLGSSVRRKLVSPWLRWCLASNLYLSFVTHLTMDVLDSQIFQFHETKYADYFYRGLMDLGLITIIYFLVARFGSRGLQSSLFILPGFLMIIAISFQESLPILTEYDWFDFRLLLVPSTCFRGSEALIKILPTFIWFHSMKTLPTEIRASGFSLIYSAGIIGKLAAPNLSILGETMDNSIPIGLCGLLCLIAGGLSFLFPKECETVSLVGPPLVTPRLVPTISEPMLVNLNRSPIKSQNSLSSYMDGSSSSLPSSAAAVAAASAATHCKGTYSQPPGSSVSINPKSRMSYDDIDTATVTVMGDALPSITAHHLHQHHKNDFGPHLETLNADQAGRGSRPSTLYNTDLESNLSDLEDLFGFDNWHLSSTSNFGQTRSNNTLSYLSFCNRRNLSYERSRATESLTLTLPNADPNSLFTL
ncbi:organic cation transporter 1-like [Tetranychus urticae]|nr:organic cation transporter 1-like [Tetranychus urticae]